VSRLRHSPHGTPGAVVVLAVALMSTPARGQDADPWLGRDKALHFSATASIAIVGYAATVPLSDDRRARAAVGAGLALGAGIGKEIWDLGGHGDASARDLVWDVIGTATGVLVAWTFDWFIRRVIATS
jgi:uncharacterized protein YfiM (DUF2279 family)